MQRLKRYRGTDQVYRRSTGIQRAAPNPATALPWGSNGAKSVPDNCKKNTKIWSQSTPTFWQMGPRRHPGAPKITKKLTCEAPGAYLGGPWGQKGSQVRKVLHLGTFSPSLGIIFSNCFSCMCWVSVLTCFLMCFWKASAHIFWKGCLMFFLVSLLDVCLKKCSVRQC